MPNSKLDQLANNASYNHDGKQAFRKEAMKLLRRLATELRLDRKDVDLRFNPGGIAVSGDAVLHCDFLYVWISRSVIRAGATVLVRECKGRKDYTGGRNQYIPTELLYTPSSAVEYLDTKLHLIPATLSATIRDEY